MKSVERLLLSIGIVLLCAADAHADWVRVRGATVGSLPKTLLANGEASTVVCDGFTTKPGKLQFWNTKRKFLMEEYSIAAGNIPPQTITPAMGLTEDLLHNEAIRCMVKDTANKALANSSEVWFKSNPAPPVGWAVWGCVAPYSGVLTSPVLSFLNGTTQKVVTCHWSKPVNEGGNDSYGILAAGSSKGVPVGGTTIRLLSTGTGGTVTFTIKKDQVVNGQLLHVYLWKDNSPYAVAKSNEMKVIK